MEWEFVYNFTEMWSVREFNIMMMADDGPVIHLLIGREETQSYNIDCDWRRGGGDHHGPWSSSNEELVVACVYYKGRLDRLWRHLHWPVSEPLGQIYRPHVMMMMLGLPYTLFRCNRNYLCDGSDQWVSFDSTSSHPVEVTCVKYYSYPKRRCEEVICSFFISPPGFVINDHHQSLAAQRLHEQRIYLLPCNFFSSADDVAC